MSDITSDYERIEKRTRIHGNIRNGVIYFFLCLWALIVLFPFYWMVLTSVKSYGSYNAEYIPKFFTLSPTLQNYVDAFTTVSLGKLTNRRKRSILGKGVARNATPFGGVGAKP